jgi:hypothetical protein
MIHWFLQKKRGEVPKNIEERMIAADATDPLSDNEKG